MLCLERGTIMWLRLTWTLSKADKNRIEAFEVWIWSFQRSVGNTKYCIRTRKRRQRTKHVEYYGNELHI